MSAILHASCVAIAGRGVLLTGRSGAGKSDLALRLIDRGAELVSDDGTAVEAVDGRLVARAGPNLAGMIEARGLGILHVPHRAEVTLALCLALDRAPERMLAEELPVETIEGVALPAIPFDPHENSAPFKVEQALILYGLPL